MIGQKEIERKFKVNQELLEVGWRRKNPGAKIFQGYLSFEPEIRIRKIVFRGRTTYFLTEKSSGTLERNEKEVEISEVDYLGMLPKIVAGLNKVRYYFEGGLEVDEYLDPELAGLITMEKEFKTKNLAEAFIPPVWAQTEVTDDKEYKNKYLARKVKEPLKIAV